MSLVLLGVSDLGQDSSFSIAICMLEMCGKKKVAPLAFWIRVLK